MALLKKKHWYIDKKFPGLFFWVSSGEHLLKNNYLKIHYEARDEVNKLVTDEGILKHFKESKFNIPNISYGNAHRGKLQTHLARYNNREFLKAGQNFKEELAKVIDDLYLKSGGIQDEMIKYLNNAINYQELIPQQIEIDE